jgi:hypothetical protein
MNTSRRARSKTPEPTIDFIEVGWKNASGTVPNRLDDLMGEAANVQQPAPELAGTTSQRAERVFACGGSLWPHRQFQVVPRGSASDVRRCRMISSFVTRT